jgi:Spy/CpxP family protein refolding chaperone
MSTGFRQLFLNRYTALAFIAGAGLSAGLAAMAAQGMGGFHHGMMMMGSPADISAHADHLLKHLYAEVDATDAQKAQIDPLVKQALADLSALHTQAQTAHTQFIQALTAPNVDRGSLEAAREAHLQLAEQASKRIVQLIGDVGDVLTPAQRQALASHLQQMHGMHGTAHPDAPSPGAPR